ncbi:unnamed protein product [Cylicocyclus nassatus]|uniref:Uncharacterized protein n=1 Tax=Cylicocyclus nassatus TaxID=53992 RepID=A0AA36DLF4_CYLNA|nr:unnamed protein product [Cylicocyclus nassatus]
MDAAPDPSGDEGGPGPNQGFVQEAAHLAPEGRQDRLLYLTCHVVMHGTATEEPRRMLMLIEVVTGRQADISVSEIYGFLRELEADLHLRNYVFCSSCCRTLSGKRIRPKRSRSQRRAVLSPLDSRSQLMTVLTKHLSLLISIHRRLHDHRLTIATDGFIPARLSRQELWPLYKTVDDLSSKLGSSYLNEILAGVLWTSKTPQEELWEVRDGAAGDIWSIGLRLSHAVVDYQGLKDIFGLPRWTSRFGCHKCLFPGNHEGSKLKWYCSDPLAFERRSSATIREDAELHRNGLRSKASAILFTPAQCCADALHVISEGVTQNRLRDLLPRSSKISVMKLSGEAISELNTALISTRNYTYSSKFVLCLEDLPSMTGAEVDMFANALFPLIGAVILCPSALCAASIVGYGFCLKELQFPGVDSLSSLPLNSHLTDFCK